MSKPKPVCEVCGRGDRKLSKDGLCPRHHEQIKKFGYALDDNPIDEDDLNEIIEYDDYAEIVLYDNLFNELENRVIIDIEDVPLVKGILWKKQGKHIVGIANQYTYDLPNLILDCNEKIEYLDENIFNNRKSNLDIVKKKKFKHHFASNKKYKNKIIITSIGNSSEDVTGTCIAIEYPLDNGQRDLILLEVGAIQTNKIQEDYIANKKMVEGIPFNLASHIFVCHAHQDHTGLLPSGITRGFNGDIITTYENAEILKPMLLDSCFIHNRNITVLNQKGKKYEALYDEGDTYTTLDRMNVYSKNEIHKVNSNLSFRFVSNNHCVGSTMLELFIKKPSGRIVKILFTSDIGTKLNQKYRPYVDDRADVPKANVCILEGTYGLDERCFTKKDVDKEVEDMMNTISKVTKEGNRVLIPIFSFDRAQAIMTLLYEHFKDNKDFKNVKVIVDSRLLNEINGVFTKILEGDKRDRFLETLAWKNFIFVSEFKKTEIFAKDTNNPYVILSSAGMLSAGHSVTYAKSILPRRNDCMLFCGYSSPNTPAGRIIAGTKSITIDNVNVPIRCQIKVYRGMTGHIQLNESISFMKSINCDYIAIHHASKESKLNLKQRAEEEFMFSGMTKKVHIIDKKHNQIII